MLTFFSSAFPVYFQSVFSSVRYLYKQHGLDHDLDEQDVKLADYVCSICAEFDTHNSRYCYLTIIRPRHVDDTSFQLVVA